MSNDNTKKEIDWAGLKAKLPTERTSDLQEKRRALFESFDPNGNGYLSLAEVDKGLTELGVTPDPLPKKVIMRAFQAAKGAHAASTNGPGADFIELCEFRLLLVYLRRYLEVWLLFENVDHSGDHRISLDEFTTAAGQLKELGNVSEAEFKAIDQNGGGMILFDEFAEWALAKLLALEDFNME